MYLIFVIFTIYVIKSYHVTVTLHCLQLHLRTYKHNYMFRDSRPNLNRTVQTSWFFNFIEDILSFLFYLSKFQYTSYRPITVADFGWRVSYVERSTSPCLLNLFIFHFALRELQLGTPPPSFWFTRAGIEPRCRRWEPDKSCYRSIYYYYILTLVCLNRLCQILRVIAVLPF
jgi:hypothetical protein